MDALAVLIAAAKALAAPGDPTPPPVVESTKVP